MPHPPGRVIDLSDSHGGTEVMAEQLKEMSEAVKKLLKGRLTEKAIICLIREFLPRGSKLGSQQIKEVLDAAASLDRYMKKEG